MDLNKLKELLEDFTIGELRENLAYLDSDEGFLDYLDREYDLELDEDYEEEDSCEEDDSYDEDDYEEDDDCVEDAGPRVHLSDEEADLADSIVDDIDNGKYTLSAIENLYPDHIITYIKGMVD